MSEVNVVQKNVRLSKTDSIMYQLMTYCFIHRITKISTSDLECLTYLVIAGESELNDFCIQMATRKIFSSAQTVRNSLNKAEKRGLIIKNGKNRKVVFISPVLNIHSEGSVLLDYKFLSVESKES